MKLYLKEKGGRKEKDWNNAAAVLSQSKKVFSIKREEFLCCAAKADLRGNLLYTLLWLIKHFQLTVLESMLQQNKAW